MRERFLTNKVCEAFSNQLNYKNNNNYFVHKIIEKYLFVD